MPSVQIKNVPEQTHAVLRRRAAQANQSLQEYLLARLVEEALDRADKVLVEGRERIMALRTTDRALDLADSIGEVLH